MIEVVGIGLDGAKGLSQEVLLIVENATVLVGSDRHLSYFPTHPAEKLIYGDFIEVIAEIQKKQAENIYKIVVLVTGDPLFFGLGRLLLEKISPDGLRFHPHLSSVQLAFNRIKVTWQDAKIISVHGRNFEELMELLQDGTEKIAILTDGKNNPKAIARLYFSLDLPTSYHCWVCENLGAVDEKISYFPLSENLEGANFAPLNVVILLKTTKPQMVGNLPMLGIADREFLSFSDRPGLMTKREIRVMVLGELGLKPGQIVWDIGAGTGSVSLEIARLCPTSQVYAIEKTAMGITLIEQNCRRLGVNNVIPVCGTAPEILAQLPAPQRIFVGGSGGNLLGILDVCQAKLTEDGVLVFAFATLEHQNICLQGLKERGFKYHLLHLSISRSVPVGSLTRFAPLNPVTIVTVSR